MGGGLFLLFKATREIHEKLEGGGAGHDSGYGQATLASVVVQIGILDLVFSLDSVITAVGMADQVGVMVSAVVIAVAFMVLAADTVSEFVSRHPTVKMLALSFLLLIGMSLLAEGFGQHISKGYIYSRWLLSVCRGDEPVDGQGWVEPVHLRAPYDDVRREA